MVSLSEYTTLTICLTSGVQSISMTTKPAKADWLQSWNPLPGYPVEVAHGGATGSDSHSGTFPPSTTTVATQARCSGSDSMLGQSSDADYELQESETYTWYGMGPPPALSLTFTVSSSAAFATINAASGQASASASASAANISSSAQALFGGTTGPTTSKTIVLASAFSHTITTGSTSKAGGYAYPGHGGIYNGSASGSIAYHQ